MPTNDAETGTKRCATCKRALPVSEFYKSKKRGLQAYCKSCSKEQVLAWQKKYAAKANAKSRTWKQGHQEQVLSYQADYREKNREKVRTYGREYMRRKRAAMSPEELRAKYRAADLWKHYRLRPEQYEAMLTAQNGACAICETKDFGERAPSVDHNHSTQQVRGLLCGHCNPLLHKLETFPGWIESAAKYLAKFTP